MTDPSAHLLPYLIPLLIIVVVVRRNLRARRLKVERLWILPVALFVGVALSLASRPPSGLIVIIGLIIALGLGGVAGWFRGRFTQISVDPDNHELASKASPVALMLIAGLFVLRYGLRLYVEQGGGAGSSGRLNAGAAALTDGLLLFSVGVVGVQRLEMWLRARRLLAESIAAKAARTKSATSA